MKTYLDNGRLYVKEGGQIVMDTTARIVDEAGNALTFDDLRNATAVTNDETLAAAQAFSAAQIAAMQNLLAIAPATVATPTADPDGGEVGTTDTVELATTTAGASIRYTLNGDVPSSTSGTVYSEPFVIPAAGNVKFIAYKAGWVSSSVVTKAFTLATVATPTANPDGGEIAAEATVTLATATEGASIRYTVDGSTPSATVGTVYSAPFVLGVAATVKFIAYKANMVSSPVVSKAFTIAE